MNVRRVSVNACARPLCFRLLQAVASRSALSGVCVQQRDILLHRRHGTQLERGMDLASEPILCARLSRQFFKKPTPRMVAGLMTLSIIMPMYLNKSV